MSEQAIIILRAGKDTRTMLRFENGVPEDTLLDKGAGTVLGNEYKSLDDARTVCQAELRKDPYAIMYILKGNSILETVMDMEHQHSKNRRSDIICAVTSTAFVIALAFCCSVFIMQFTTPLAHILFTGGMTLLYILGLCVCGAGNLETLFIMIIIFVMLALVVPGIRKNMKPKAVRTQTVTQPQH